MTENQNPDKAPNAEQNTFSGQAQTEQPQAGHTADGTFRQEKTIGEPDLTRASIGEAINLGGDQDAANFFINQVMSLNIFKEFQRKIMEYVQYAEATIKHERAYRDWKKDFKAIQADKEEQRKEKEAKRKEKEQEKKKEEKAKKQEEAAKKRDEKAKQKEEKAKQKEKEKEKEERAKKRAEKNKKKVNAKQAAQEAGTRKKTTAEHAKRGRTAKSKNNKKKQELAGLKNMRHQIRSLANNNMKNRSATRGRQVSRPKGKERG